MPKLAAVSGPVKQYRRAVQLLQTGTHAFHGGDLPAILAAGGVRDTAGAGAYWSKGAPVYDPFKRRDYFAAGGPIGSQFAAYEARQEQVTMALGVEAALADKKSLLVEAGNINDQMPRRLQCRLLS